MILATLRMGLGGREVLTLNDAGIWESENRPTLAEMLNMDFKTSPRQQYSPVFGGPYAFYIWIAKEVAEKYHAEIELAPLPPEPEYPPGTKF